MPRLHHSALVVLLALLSGCGRPAVPPEEPRAALESLPRQVPALEAVGLSDLNISSLSSAPSEPTLVGLYRMTGAAAPSAGVTSAAGVPRSLAPPISVASGGDVVVTIVTHRTAEGAESALRKELMSSVDYFRKETPYGLIHEVSQRSMFCVGRHFVDVRAASQPARDAALPAQAARALQADLAGDPGGAGLKFFGRPLW